MKLNSQKKVNRIEAIIIETTYEQYLYFPKLKKWALPMYQERYERNTQITIMEHIDELIQFHIRNEIIIDRIYANGEEYEETLEKVKLLMINYRKVFDCLKEKPFQEEVIYLHYFGKRINRYLEKIVSIYRKKECE
jgi:hypothetical protein